MCGIAGAYGRESDATKLVSKMLNKIKHRGPDDYGIYVDGEAAIGMSRLRIRSRETDTVPFQLGQHHYTAFNGEIYAVHSSNLKFSKQIIGGTDEVRAMLAINPEFIPDGMYSIADLNNKRLTLIRDKFGIKPLYYQDSNDSFYFCSEALPLLDTTFC